MSSDPKHQRPAFKIRVLQVEDSPLDAELILRQLKRHGFAFESKRVSTEDNFRDALMTFAPDIILSDYSMPVFDGSRALELTLDIAGGTPFIFVSGSIRPSDAAEARKRGAYDFLAKDDLTRLGDAIEKALNESTAKDAGVAGRNGDEGR